MRIAVMQPYCFPYIGYFQLVHAVDAFVFLTDVTTGNNKWLNSNVIADGRFTLPLHGGRDQNKQIRELRLIPKELAKFYKRLNVTYGRAAQARQSFKWKPAITDNFVTYATNGIKIAADYMDAVVDCHFSHDIPHTGTGQDRIISICKHLGATTYVNPIGGVELYDPEAFAASGVELRFLRTHCAETLSIIHLLMNYSQPQLADMLKEYQLLCKHELVLKPL